MHGLVLAQTADQIHVDAARLPVRSNAVLARLRRPGHGPGAEGQRRRLVAGDRCVHGAEIGEGERSVDKVAVDAEVEVVGEPTARERLLGAKVLLVAWGDPAAGRKAG